MKICYLANVQSIHTQRWARHFVSRGYQVTVISFQRGAIDGVTVIDLPSVSAQPRLNILLRLSMVRRLVRDIDPDILHAHYVTSYGFAGALSGRHPLVITAWGSDVFVMPEGSWIYRQIVRFALRRADLITSMAKHMTRHLIERRYAVAEKIVTLPFGVDTDVFNPTQRSRRHSTDSPLVVSTRRLDHGLDVNLFIQAIPEVLKCYPNAKFVVTGDGPLRPQLEHLAADLGIKRHVEFRGEISHLEMTRLLGRADVFVSTSRSDGNNISLNEAMACGAFPVATDIPANRVWVENGRNGLLFPCHNSKLLANSINEALQKPEWRQATMAQNWEIICKRASWQDKMAEMETWYASLVH